MRCKRNRTQKIDEMQTKQNETMKNLQNEQDTKMQELFTKFHTSMTDMFANMQTVFGQPNTQNKTHNSHGTGSTSISSITNQVENSSVVDAQI